MRVSELIAELQTLPQSAEILVLPEEIKRDRAAISVLAQHIDGIKAPAFVSREQKQDHEGAMLVELITRNF